MAQENAKTPAADDAENAAMARADDVVLLDRIAKRFKEMSTASNEWRVQAKGDFDYEAGRQWDEDSLAKLAEMLRPAITFNRISPIVNVICGLEVSNRQEVTYYPRQPGDASASDILCGAAKWVRDTCNAEDEESDAFRDAVICGLGWTQTRLDYTEDLDGKIVIERVTPLEMFWDDAADKRNLSDARDLMRVRSVPRAFILDTWPEKAEEIDAFPLWQAGDAIAGLVEENINEPGDAYNRTSHTSSGGRSEYVKLVEYQWSEMETIYRVADPTTGQMVELPEDRYQAAMAMAQQQGVQLMAIPQRRRKWYSAFCSGKVLLQRGECPCPTSSTYKAITGHRDLTKGSFYGVVRHMRDPQAWANKWLSQTLHIINTNAKGGLLIEEGAVKDLRKFNAEYARPDVATVVTPGAISGGKIQPKPQAPFPQTLAELMRFAIDSIREVSGITQESVGIAEGQTNSGILEFQRKQTSMSVLAGLFDALRHYRKSQGGVLLYLIQTYLNDGRLIRIAGEAGREQYVQLSLDPAVAKYDIVVDEAPTSPNQRDRVWQVLTTILPQAAQLGLPIPVEVLEYLPIPASLAAAWREKVQPSQPDPNAQMMQQLQMKEVELRLAAMQAQIDASYADAESRVAQTELKGEELKIKAATAAADIGHKQAGAAATIAAIGKTQSGVTADQARAVKEQQDTEQLRLSSQLQAAKTQSEITRERIRAKAEEAKINAQLRIAEIEAQGKMAEQSNAAQKLDFETGALAKAKLFAEVLSDVSQSQQVISQLGAMGISPASIMALLAQAVETVNTADQIQ